MSMAGGQGHGDPIRTAERRRNVALAALAAAALVLHVALLGSLEGLAVDESAAGAPPSALVVRLLSPNPPTPQAMSVPEPAVPVPTRPPPRVAPPQAAALVATPSATAPSAEAIDGRSAAPGRTAEPAELRAEAAPPADELASAAPAEVGASNPREAVAEAPVSSAAPAVAEAQALPSESAAVPTPTSAADRELPVYRTLIPPPIQLRYRLRRGALQGSGDFAWSPQGERYEARLEGRLAGIVVLTQVSQGGFDEAGVAPLRFTDRRTAGAVQAANFQREVGKISFSGPSVEYPLLIGSQDRLSWMVQLAAVVAAEPRRLQEGGKVVIHVVGARGDSRLWVFRFAGNETISAVAGTVRAARFVREATEAHDTRVDVWLDPLRHHLPARALLRSGADDEGLELLVQEAAAVP
ncbi:MAG: hypothetical protein AD742_01020 [Methylibium sp. NZG]|nr:MAG: hypothetical protein AD742_01020 [Methylibium sp. NZG]